MLVMVPEPTFVGFVKIGRELCTCGFSGDSEFVALAYVTAVSETMSVGPRQFVFC